MVRSTRYVANILNMRYLWIQTAARGETKAPAGDVGAMLMLAGSWKPSALSNTHQA